MGLRAPNQMNWHCVPICPFDLNRFDFSKIGQRNRTSHPHGLLDFAVHPTLPDHEIGNHSRIIQHFAHGRSRKHGNLLAVHAIAIEAPSIPSDLPANLSKALFHHLISIPVLSSKIPLTGSFFKESVKVCTPESPSSADDSTLDLSALNVFTHRTRTQAQHLCRIVERQQTIS